MNRTVDYFSLEGKTALVTGASSGIGRAIALAYAKAGADIVVTGRNELRLGALNAEVSALRRQVRTVIGDLSNPAGLSTILDSVSTSPIDILVNAAGVLPNPLKWSSLAEWRKVLELNLLAPVALCEVVSEGMIKRRRGKIINVTSIGDTHVPSRNMEMYGTSKAALKQFSKCLAVTLGAYNIQVNVLSPGLIETPLSRALPETYMDNFKLHTPQKKGGTLEDVSSAALLLASRASDFMTGSTLVVDGGFSARTFPLPHEYQHYFSDLRKR